MSASVGRPRKKLGIQKNNLNAYFSECMPEINVEKDIVEPVINELISKATKSTKKLKHDGTKVGSKTFNECKCHFLWLVVETIEGDKCLNCEICRSAARPCKLNTVWAFEGSSNIQLSTVRKHANSNDHQTACSYLDKLKQQTPTAETSAMSDDEDSSLSSLVTKEDRILFNTVYTVSKEELPSEKLNILLTLQRQNGLAIQYKNLSWDSIDGIQKAISKVLTHDLVSDIKASPTYAIMLDESNDINVQKRLSVCVRYEKKGEAVSKFLFNSFLRDGKSHTIVNCIAEEFQKLGICLSKCTNIATDGAAVMTGKKLE